MGALRGVLRVTCKSTAHTSKGSERALHGTFERSALSQYGLHRYLFMGERSKPHTSPSRNSASCHRAIRPFV
eukprot:492126-Prorocentrum_minimum.AAC.2